MHFYPPHFAAPIFFSPKIKAFLCFIYVIKNDFYFNILLSAM